MQENTSNNIENFNRKVSWFLKNAASFPKHFFRFHSRAQLFLFFTQKMFLSTNSQILTGLVRNFSSKKRYSIPRKNVTSVSSSIEAYARQSWKTRSVSSGNVRLDPINASQFDRGGVYIGSMPIHHALQVSALLREGMFRGYL